MLAAIASGDGVNNNNIIILLFRNGDIIYIYTG